MRILRVKRVRDLAAAEDGRRILVDRLWPRGLTKDQVGAVAWIRTVAPSDALRKWFGHDPDRWDEFRRRYFAELDANPEAVAELRASMAEGRGVVTLLFGARDRMHNNAVALAEYLHRRDDFDTTPGTP